MYVFRISNSGKAIHRIYPAQAQEAFLEGHIVAFHVLRGIPTKHIRYDNLISAVAAVMVGQGQQHQENDRRVLFRSHYGFDTLIVPARHRRGTRKRRSRRGSGVVPPQQRFDPFLPPSLWTSSTTASGTGKPRLRPGGSMTESHPRAGLRRRTALPGTAAGRGLRPRLGAEPQGGQVLDDHRGW